MVGNPDLRKKTYSELIKRDTLLGRFNYLKLGGQVGRETFGFDRYLNQGFYTSVEWKNVRQYVIARDLGCDLGVEGHEIHGRILVHHMNPVIVEDIKHSNEDILNPDYLITTTHQTHNAIHYGNERLLPCPFIERMPGDTKLW